MYTWHKWALWVRNTCRPSIHNRTGLEHLEAGLGAVVQWAGGRKGISEGRGPHRWSSSTKSCHGDWWAGRGEHHKQSPVCRSNPSPVMLPIYSKSNTTDAPLFQPLRWHVQESSWGGNILSGFHPPQRGREPIANSISYMTSGNPKTTLSARPFFPFTKHGCTQTKVTWYLSIISFFFLPWHHVKNVSIEPICLLKLKAFLSFSKLPLFTR